jgi:hypothetical protein
MRTAMTALAMTAGSLFSGSSTSRPPLTAFTVILPIWKRGFVFGIARYMSAVAQPDEEPKLFDIVQLDTPSHGSK